MHNQTVVDVENNLVVLAKKGTKIKAKKIKIKSQSSSSSPILNLRLNLSFSCTEIRCLLQQLLQQDENQKTTRT
jgi:hypothetical protein